MAPSPRRLFLVPHTHWDREWYLPFEAFRERLVEMMDGLIELLDHEPRFAHFHLDGQTAMIRDYLDVRPEREPDIQRLARAGKLSVGPWFTQMDEFMVSGESLVRNLEWGLADTRDLAGLEPNEAIGYLPDQFGHVAQMPQILSNAGIHRAMVWRGVPSAVESLTFRWAAPDGSAVLTEYLLSGYWLGGALLACDDAACLAKAIDTCVRTLEPMAARDRLLVTVGADHTIGSAKLAPLLEDVRASGGVTAEISSLAEYLNDGDPGHVPGWTGELRSAARAHLLPNVYSNRIHQKRDRAQVEALVERYAEPLAALVPGFAWPSEDLERCWRLLLWNGAHDSVCGCGADEVARDVDARYAEARTIAARIRDEALAALASLVRPSGVLRFNPSPFEREGIPGLSWTVEDTDPGSAAGPVEVAFTDGWIRLDDVEIRLLEEPDVGDLYTFCPVDGSIAAPPHDLRVENGAVVAGWDGCRVRLVPRRMDGEPFVRVDGQIDNDRPDHRLRLHVRLREHADGSTAMSPFAMVDRPPVGEGSEWEAPSPTWPAGGAVLAGGMAVYEEGVFEYEVTGSELAVTLLRATGTISRDSLATRPWPAGPGVPTPEAQMLGRTRFALGLQTGARSADLHETWERFALPLVSVPAPGGGDLPGRGSLLETGRAALSAIRRVGGDVEVRVWNPSGEQAVVSVAGQRLDLGPFRIQTVRLNGQHRR